jgi:hypothetical protein
MAQLPSFGFAGHPPINWPSSSTKSSDFQYPPGLFAQPSGLRGFAAPQVPLQNKTEPSAPFQPNWQPSGVNSTFSIGPATDSKTSSINTQHPPHAALHLKPATAGAQQSPSPIAPTQRAPLPSIFPQPNHVETSTPSLRNSIHTMGRRTSFRRIVY